MRVTFLGKVGHCWAASYDFFRPHSTFVYFLKIIKNDFENTELSWPSYEFSGKFGAHMKKKADPPSRGGVIFDLLKFENTIFGGKT